MKRLLFMLIALAALTVPVVASGKIVQLGEADPALPKSNCPEDPCEAIYQVTGYQERAEGSKRRPYVIRRDGLIVAFSVKLGELTVEQIESFDRRFGGKSSVRIAILRKGRKRSNRNDHRVLAKSEVHQVERLFGTTPTFVLEEPLSVKRGNIVALTVPTWLPALASDQDESTLWRSSRRKRRCGTSGPPARLAPPAPQGIGQLATWSCNYTTARLLYTATYIPENREKRQPAEEGGEPQSRPG